MFKRILVPLDGSARAEQALPIAVRLAQASGGTILLVQVVPPAMEYTRGLAPAPLWTEQIVNTEVDDATSYLKKIAQSSLLTQTHTTTKVQFGRIAPDILATAEEQDADLIVICSHGRTGFTRWMLGSVAHHLVHQSPVPVLVLREGGTAMLRADATQPLCALVPLDSSPLAERALVPATDLITALSAPASGIIHVMQVVKPLSSHFEEGFIEQFNAEVMERAKDYLKEIKGHLQEKNANLTVKWSGAFGSDVASTILDTAEDGHQEGDRVADCNVIALSTHGRGGLERWVMGSITERILNATKLPVLVVRPPKKHEN